jgi:hypothetical protein
MPRMRLLLLKPLSWTSRWNIPLLGDRMGKGLGTARASRKSSGSSLGFVENSAKTCDPQLLSRLRFRC